MTPGMMPGMTPGMMPGMTAGMSAGIAAGIAGLPIAPFLPEIAAALSGGGVLVLCAETGAGKTTALPAYLAAGHENAGQQNACLADTVPEDTDLVDSGPEDTDLVDSSPVDTGKVDSGVPRTGLASSGRNSGRNRGLTRGRIIILEPRRIAAMAAARRSAALLGESVGRTIGFRVRGASSCGPCTRVEFVTEAVFLRMIQDDPFVEDVSLVIFDEFHERSLVADLALAFVVEAREARSDLALLVMSATLDINQTARYLDCPTLSVPGRSWPVELRYRPGQLDGHMETTVIRAVREALDATSGDVLVFLPGMKEIRQVQTALASVASQRDCAVLVLHGSMSLEAQQRVVSADGLIKRRIILSTNIAETSLTVPRITAVVDAGLSRFMTWHRRSGLNRLETGRVSLAEAEQRRGRAGRLGRGLCIRCWDEYITLAASRGPEIARSGLAGLVLECAARGVDTPEALRWLTNPPKPAWDAGMIQLIETGLLDGPVGNGRTSISAAGQRALSLGIDPRPAAALVSLLDVTAGRQHSPALHAAILACAVLGERDSEDFGTDGDFASRLERVLAAPRQACHATILAETRRLASRLGIDAFDPGLASQSAEPVGNLLAPGFPDRLARLLPDGTWEFKSGRRARAVAELPRSDWILALDVDAGDPLGTIRQAAALTDQAARRALESAATVRVEPEWRALQPAFFERHRAGCFVLSERRLIKPDPALLQQAFDERVDREGLAWLPWDESSRALIARLRYASRLGSIADNAWHDDRLATALKAAAGPYLQAGGPIIDSNGLGQLLSMLAGHATIAQLDRVAPAFITTPGGRRRRPVYPADGPARLAMRIQEAFGMQASPLVCGRPAVIELLSPADRPIQVSDDLPSFWSNVYPTLRTELGRRYPKHYWPINPLTAEPTKGTKPRQANRLNP
jgi:ATP-dependent helicase HrpB